MMKTTFALLMLITLTSVVYAQQQRHTVAINLGFFTAEEFLHMPETQQAGFAAGLVDGIYVSPLLGAAEGNIEQLHKCIVGMSDAQVAAIIARYLKDHPERWHKRLNTEAFTALDTACHAL
jgi:hypothetical protein